MVIITDEMKKAIDKIFAIFTGKHPWCSFIKKRVKHSLFLVNIAELLRRPILKNICEWLHLKMEVGGDVFRTLSSIYDIVSRKKFPQKSFIIS